MKLPVSWLADYVDFDLSPEELAEKLTSSGTEVESIDVVGGDYEGIVVGEVLRIDPHPSADRLQLCLVSDGSRELPVVCGASNFEIGDKAPFAGVGVELPGGMKIRKARIRGEESEGMLCAEDELGLSDDHAGIMLLPRDIETGTPFAEVIGPPETVLNMEVTWNRADCLSIIGMARELAALLGTGLKIPTPELDESGAHAADGIAVTIEAEDLCPRYTARLLNNVQLAPSPLWMQRRLALCGVRPINNIVDVTNYVMLECGHPLHAFDYSLVEDQKIIVRCAAGGESMATLDGQDRPITGETLLIADARRPVAIAGVMGGAGSEIGENTSSVLLESASFDPASIRRTSSQLGLSTESSHRFERGVDPDGVEWASDRAASLMAQLGGADVAAGIVDVYPGRPVERKVTVRFDSTRRLLGVDIPNDDMVDILNSLCLTVIDRDELSCTVLVPTFRRDIEIEADLIEEIARMHGVEQISESVPASCVVPGASDMPFQMAKACRADLVGLGLSETMNYSFVSAQLLDLCGKDDRDSRVVLPNPVSAEHAVMRNSLVPQMVETLGRNLSRQIHETAFFEMGKVFLKKQSGEIYEEDRLCMGFMGPLGRTCLDKRRPVEKEEPFLWLKGALEALILAKGQGEVQFRSVEHPYYETGSSVSISICGRDAGFMGLLRQDIRKKWRMQTPVAVGELALDKVMSARNVAPELTEISMYPSISRDVAMVVPESATHENIVRIMRDSAPVELTAVELFDIFRTEGLGQGKKSLAYSLEFRSLDRNLTDEDANKYHETIKTALKKELGAEIRDS